MPSQVPHSREAEEAVVGAVLINPEVYYDVAQFLQADDFYIHRHQWIWQAFTSLHEQRIPVDLLTLTEELDRKNQLNEIGGPAYLTSLVNQVPTSINAESYGHIVESHSTRRKIINAANQAVSRAYNENIPIESVLSEAKGDFQELDTPAESEFTLISSYVTAEYDRIGEGKAIPSTPLGWIDLDRMVKVAKGDLVLIAGRPGQGKTGLLLGIAKHTVKEEKKKVALFSLEMSNEQVTRRLLSQETEINPSRLRDAKLEEREWPLFIHAVEEMGRWKLFLHDVPAINPSQIWSACRKLQKSKGLDLVIVDYLQLMGSDKKTENRTQEVSYISRNLKVLARELNIPVIAAAQLSRAVEQRSDKRPVLSDLRESGSLEQDADIVMFIYHPDQYDKNANAAEIIVAKDRNGPVGTVNLIFRTALAKFENAATKMFCPNETAATYAQNSVVGSED